jgi:type IV pilus assembly protein PilY1
MKYVNVAGFNNCVLRKAGLLLLVLGSGHAGVALAQTSADFAAVPPLITQSAPPNVMLVMSDDHELYKKAYSDFSDINGDGIFDLSYEDDFTYSGYFDSNFCYSYGAIITTEDGPVTGFKPGADISASLGTTGHSCASVAAKWSGNFLNWASMTRMDIVRDVLFGGMRKVDTATDGATPGVTVLERVFLPEDVHSFVKVFEGDTEKYTPFNQDEISICNTTFGAANKTPVLRVAKGDWPLWASSEVVQCHYSEEQNSGLGNQPTATDKLADDYNAFVQVCVTGMDATGKQCKPYTTSGGVVTYKPVGLLQQYGDVNTINFGLITGSYNKKTRGGVLRKDILPLTGSDTTDSRNEINLTTGQFLHQIDDEDDDDKAGIINTINKLHLLSWDYSGNRYTDCNTYSIPKSDFLNSGDSGRQCRNWGNPLSEIYLEALRYFRGDEVNDAASGEGLATEGFDDDADDALSLPQVPWTDPLTEDNACASCSIIVLSSGLNSFDRDDLGSVTDLGLSTGALDDLVDEVGDMEGITGGSYLIGGNGDVNDDSCTAKEIPYLSAARGICPEIGSLEGGFDIAGLAFHAFTEDLRDDFDGLQNVSTYSVALAQNLPSFEFNVNGKAVTFVPICQANTDGGDKLDEGTWTNCSFVDAKIESQSATGGRMYVAWEDSLWGNDFDMDAVSRIEWCIGNNTAACPGEVLNADYNSGRLNNNADNGNASRLGHTYADHWAWKTSGLSADSIQFRVSLPQKAAGNAMKFGISISGVKNVVNKVTKFTNTPTKAMSIGTYCVENDGDADNSECNNDDENFGKYVVRFTQGNGEQFFILGQGGYTIARLSTNSGNRMIFHEPVVYTADANVTAGKLLPNPLYFTAKYGSFNDIDGDGTPSYNDSTTDHREWDTRNINGQEVADGIPDNFFPIADPSQLSSSLSQIFNIIAARVSSGTAAAVVANSSSGLGSVYQAYYHPEYTDDDNERITWGGVLHSLFFDASGRFREDNGIPGKLEDTSIDYVVDFFYDTSVTPNRTRYKRYVQTGNQLDLVVEPLHDLEEFGSVWNARDVLADISQTNIIQQRAVNGSSHKFSEDAGTKRYIFTYLDNPTTGTQGVVDAGEVVDFTDTNFISTNGNNNFRYLGLNVPTEAADLVNYIRGKDKSGWRSRLVNIPGDGTDTSKYWVLGDIVHSSPLVVSPPNKSYDTVNGDDTYSAFRQKYQRRRQMIYAGANDGMLHAFNAGVWAPELKEFKTQTYNSVTGVYDQGQSHELGAEMWAYVPMNLLPHLQWLKEVNYPHVYYMDAPPQTFDVNIFADDATHPNGWGTILVAGMRLGGGDFQVDLDNDGTKETTMRSSIVILDVTDPEQPPQLIAELNSADLGFTTSMPTLAKVRRPSASGSYLHPAENNWMLVFGSGPDDLDSVVSTSQNAKLFAYDLVAKAMVTIDSAVQTPATDPHGFFGDLRAVDWNNDMADDAVFGGTIEGTEAAPTGRMKRIVLDKDSSSLGFADGGAAMSDVINMAKPVSAAPNFQKSISKQENWLVFGTGRLFTTQDNRSETQQSFYGIKEPNDYTTTPTLVTESALVDSTNILVQGNGNISDNRTVGDPVVRSGTTLETYNELYSFMDNKPGWMRNLAFSSGTNPSERVFTSTLFIGTSLLFTSYLPAADLCTVEGNSFLYVLNFRTGTAEKFAPIGEDGSFGDDEHVIADSLSLGIGAASGAVGIVSTGTDPGVDGESAAGVSIISTNSTGDNNINDYSLPPSDSSRISWEQLEIPF